MSTRFRIVTDAAGPESTTYPTYDDALDVLLADPDYTEGDMSIWIEEC